jgi:hypothetical protein
LIIPSGDSLGIEINNGHLNIGTTISNYRHSWATYVTRTYATNSADWCIDNHQCN